MSDGLLAGNWLGKLWIHTLPFGAYQKVQYREGEGGERERKGNGNEDGEGEGGA